LFQIWSKIIVYESYLSKYSLDCFSTDKMTPLRESQSLLKKSSSKGTQ